MKSRYECILCESGIDGHGEQDSCTPMKWEMSTFYASLRVDYVSLFYEQDKFKMGE